MGLLKKYVKTIPYKNKKRKRTAATEDYANQLPSEAQERPLFDTIDQNFGFLNSTLGSDIGLVEAKYAISQGKTLIGIVYIESIVDAKLIIKQIIEPVLGRQIEGKIHELPDILQTRIIAIPHLKQSNQMKQVMEGLLEGSTILFIDGLDTALIIGTGKLGNRSIEKPDNEVTVLAANDSFIEDLETNCSLIIRRLPSPNLQFKTFTVGKISQTKVKLLWLKGIANEKVIAEVQRRLEQINIDNVTGIGEIAELIQDNPITIFPKYKQSQRPDTVAKILTEGQFAILSSNSPFALIAPITFWENFKTMDDYSETSLVGTYYRLIRISCFFILSLISPLYLSFVTYNHTIVPPALALNIAKGREGVPFPSVVEVVILTISITIIREASLRISGSVGFFIGTLSAVVIGQASVSAGYVSASVIIVVAASAIATFAVSTTTLVFPSRIITYFFIGLASIFGMFGLVNGIIIVTWHMLTLESFGVPYLYPIVPFEFEGLKDTFVRAPYKFLNKRLPMMAPQNQTKINKKKE